MARESDARRTVEVDRLLAGAAETIAKVRYCWLVTEDAAGGVHVRPMGRILRDAGESEWTVSFLADGRSRKVAEMRRAGGVTVLFEREAEDAYVAATGSAVLHEDAAQIRRRWKSAYDVYFPREADRAHATFVGVEVTRLELWIRGVTPEPFGLRPTVLERDGEGRWRLTSH